MTNRCFIDNGRGICALYWPVKSFTNTNVLGWFYRTKQMRTYRSVLHCPWWPCIDKVRQYSEEWDFNNRSLVLLSQKDCSSIVPLNAPSLFFLPFLFFHQLGFSSVVSFCHSHFLYLSVSVVVSLLISPIPSFMKEKEEDMNATHRLWVTRCSATSLPPDFFHLKWITPPRIFSPPPVQETVVIVCSTTTSKFKSFMLSLWDLFCFWLLQIWLR